VKLDVAELGRLLLRPSVRDTSTAQADTYSKYQSVCILTFPESVYHVDLDEVLGIGVEGTHEEVYVMEKVELPTFAYQRVTQEVLERHRIAIELLGEIADPCELPW